MAEMRYPVRLHLESASEVGTSPAPTLHQDRDSLVKGVQAFAGRNPESAEELADRLLNGERMRLRDKVLYAEQAEGEPEDDLQDRVAEDRLENGGEG